MIIIDKRKTSKLRVVGFNYPNQSQLKNLQNGVRI